MRYLVLLALLLASAGCSSPSSLRTDAVAQAVQATLTTEGVTHAAAATLTVVAAAPAKAASGVIPTPIKAPPSPVSKPAATPARPTAVTPQAITQGNEMSLNLTSGVELVLVRIPAGEFIMGSDASDAYEDQRPQRTINLNAYLIGKYPVTVAQFAVFAQATGYRTCAEKAGGGDGYVGDKYGFISGANWQRSQGSGSNAQGRVNHPVTLVNWSDAMAFCQWVSQVTGLGVRLPTEAEWEKAARGTDGRLYPWGNDAPDTTRCNFGMNLKDTTPVGKYSPSSDSPFGIVDMAGNAWQWTSSLYQPYPYRTDDGRENPNSSGRRIFRGGAFESSVKSTRSTHRGQTEPSACSNVLGFRVVISAGMP